ncbi:MAG TPA: beta-ketoacyl-[acyl-carrier-protein] synthase family protein [Amycolatopsis sp.]|uniref:beta-ketoacyl-[acyl-carrier-protein] synthase family protein n=1 Tax=Amycolatopsis sp. TaxID=37632 RepID=UPI002B469110|nr:beta-ketoacyl-[acyl-carrier-protein] synthase family protein [Amycolatopsis sp.]HKS47169.1 beta-ketoacyl-[acyl-carrier-protein] synthase family protein [Amycolatopsis sp.]
MPGPGPRRVVVTGMGVVSSIGTGIAEFAEGLRAGRSGTGPVTAFDTAGFPSGIACEVRGFEPERWVRTVPLERLGRAGGMAVAAARMAVDDARARLGDLRGRRGLVAIGTTCGESQDMDALAVTEVAEGAERMDPRLARRVPAHLLALSVAHELRLSNVDAYAIGTACAAGNYAIGEGFDAVRTGQADFALCGGSDAFNRLLFAGFHRLGLIARDACRPFDSDRSGTLLGEGAGVLLLESLDGALVRNAPIYTEVLGYGLNCDGRHPVAPTRSSVAECMRLALDDAGIKPHEVDLICAHGTGTAVNDATECGAIHDIYGERTPRVVGVKSMLGHTLGAASALGAIASSLAITHRFIPPTINHRTTDPECAVDCVPNRAIEADLRVVQNNGLAFGGDNAVVLFGRYQETNR